MRWIILIIVILLIVGASTWLLIGAMNPFEQSMNKGDDLYSQGDIDGAIEAYEKARTHDQIAREPVEKLARIYEEKGDIQAMLDMIKDIQERKDSVLYSIFTPELPQLSVRSGTYEEPFYLELTTDKDADIYYTLDGSTPTEQSIKYSEPVYISEPETKFAAISITKYNVRSIVTRADYRITAGG